HRMKPVAEVGLGAGELRVVDGELVVGAANGAALRLDEVQMEGKPRMAGGAFAKDFQVKAGERVE
ncbi:MAG: methionyl-tRNA formyltransferase, partial [Acidobacteriota bacterium]